MAETFRLLDVAAEGDGLFAERDGAHVLHVSGTPIETTGASVVTYLYIDAETGVVEFGPGRALRADGGG